MVKIIGGACILLVMVIAMIGLFCALTSTAFVFRTSDLLRVKMITASKKGDDYANRL